MPDQFFTDVFGNSVTLTAAVYQTILLKHPEVILFFDQLEQVLLTPEQVRESTHDPRVRLYYRYTDNVLNGKWLVVVVKFVDRGYVSTVYATTRVKLAKQLWPT